MDIRRRYKRSNLFLVRLWAKDGSDGTANVEWRGKVQRVADGESHEFVSLPDLVNLLLAMIANKEGR